MTLVATTIAARLRRIALLSVVGALAGVSCIAYDQDIGVLSQDFNKAPVRIVEAVYVSEQANEACIEESNEELGACPVLQTAVEQVPHLLNYKTEPSYDFCACRKAQRRDMRGLRPFAIRVEDQDANDAIFAALILDFDQSNAAGIPPNWKYYAEYLDPNSPLQNDKSSFYDRDVLNRPPPNVRSVELGRTTVQIDLCNSQAMIPLPQGWHTLTVLVTDRPWFKSDQITQRGVPDLARGATFDAASFSFYCKQEPAEGIPVDKDKDECECNDAQTTN